METQTSSSKAPKAPRKLTAASTKPLKKVVKIEKSEDGKIALKTICAKLGIETRAARRKLRNADLDFHGARDRWSFTEKQAAKVRELLA